MELTETHPEYVYCILQGAGIIRRGRPIRGNFHCYKLPVEHAPELERLFEKHGSGHESVGRFIDAHKIKWSQRVDHNGYEAWGYGPHYEA